MTNPDNIVRVRARNGGRASVYEANAWCQNWTTGFVDGAVTQNTSADMNVLIDGAPGNPLAVIAATPAPYHIALDIVGQKAIAITAPASNSRYSAIVAYTDDLSLPSTEDTVTGSPASCGLIVVNGETASSPVVPSDREIRAAITADGATGSQAAYAVLAYVLVASDTTVITDTLIKNNISMIKESKVLSLWPIGSYYETSDTTFDPNIAWGGTWVEDTDGKVLVAKNSGTFATVGATGGEETHKLVENELPKISGSWTIHGQDSGTEFYVLNGHATGTLKSNQYKSFGSTPTPGANSYSSPGFVFGNNGSHNNLQPYIVIKRWHRIA